MENGKTFDGKVAFVTGGGSGIGRVTACAFAREGASVSVVGHTPEDNTETVRLIKESGGRTLDITCDVTRSSDIESAVQRTLETCGRLDFAFNNAGVEQPVKPILDVTDEEWDRVLDVNLRGVFLCMKHELAQMLAQGGGVIVN